MKKYLRIYLIVMMCFSCIACAKQSSDIEPEASQMKSICELATMECYYHNVAKYNEKDASGMWWWQKDRNFWMEYAGVVTIGIDASLLNIEVVFTEEDKFFMCRRNGWSVYYQCV